MRLRLDLGYHGRDFHGWAIQNGLRTVQGVLQEWIPRVLRLPEPVDLTCAGRTDAGVHARGQVAHFDVDPDLATVPPGYSLAGHLQYKLARAVPHDLVVRAVREVSTDFDARFSALWRRYAYRVCDGAPDVLARGFVVDSRNPIDVELFNEAAKVLLGLHDFAAFCRPRDGASTIRTLLELSAVREGPLVTATVRADAFCHSQVRSLMGALVTVATGQRDLNWVTDLLTREQRAGEIPVFPAHGLCLEEVAYPPDAELANRALAARRKRVSSEIPDLKARP